MKISKKDKEFFNVSEFKGIEVKAAYSTNNLPKGFTILGQSGNALLLGVEGNFVVVSKPVSFGNIREIFPVVKETPILDLGWAFGGMEAKEYKLFHQQGKNAWEAEKELITAQELISNLHSYDSTMCSMSVPNNTLFGYLITHPHKPNDCQLIVAIHTTEYGSVNERDILEFYKEFQRIV